MMNVSSAFLLLSIVTCAVTDIIVKIPNGILRGRKEYSLRGISFYAFQQIPFAKPPVGELRFREPQPAENWKGILDATRNDKSCIQFGNTYNANISYFENEDCLYLNVYTPKYPSTGLTLPVMYHIYGGGFLNGAANFDYAGPHYLLESGVIVVTVNYRVGAFELLPITADKGPAPNTWENGFQPILIIFWVIVEQVTRSNTCFLSTGDKVIPGNYGLKDQQMGLKWVRDNIKYFGGDPRKVTIFGQSAGASSVAFQLMSEGSKGLFRAAIAQSGTNIIPWAYQRSYKTLAFKIGAVLGGTFNEHTDSKKLLEFLRTIPAKKLNEASTHVWVDNLFIDQMTDGFTFTPVIEPEHETAFITENMYGAIENGRMHRVPLIIGMCSEEQLGKVIESGFESQLQKYDDDITLLVSRNMHVTDKNQLTKIAQTIRQMYTKGRLEDDHAAAIRYFSDASFTRSIIRHAQLQSKFSDVYFYQFSYSGELGNNKGPFLNGAEKVKHGEDAGYIWAWSNWTGLNYHSKEDILTSDRYRTLFTNFAIYLNPTLEPSTLFQNLTWPKVTPINFQYLNINKTLSIEKNPREGIYEKWLKIYEEMAVKPYDTF